VLTKISSYEPLEDNELENVDSKINEIIEICKNNSKFDNSEDNW